MKEKKLKAFALPIEEFEKKYPVSYSIVVPGIPEGHVAKVVSVRPYQTFIISVDMQKTTNTIITSAKEANEACMVQEVSCMTKEEILSGFDNALHELKSYREGKLELKTLEDLSCKIYTFPSF